MRKNKKISLLLATMLVAMAFTGCGEKEKETKETVAVETTTAEQAETTGAEGETQEVSDDVFADIFDDVEINGKQVTFPFSLNDLGDEYTIDEEPFAVNEENKLHSYDLYYNEKKIAIINYTVKDANSKVDRDKKVTRYYSLYDEGNIKIRGVGLGDNLEKVSEMIPELVAFGEAEDKNSGYALWNSKNYIEFYAENNEIIQITIRSEVE
ncbi:MAG: hypothetical protein IJA27_04340 [Lachnospiraceae bacterium]|nr:hypothetical protein [Lachnospiraceae bacterium]